MRDRKQLLQTILDEAQVRIDGKSPYDIQIRDPAVFDRIFSTWSLGFGEGYMDGQWECERLDELLYRLLRVDLGNRVKGLAKFQVLYSVLRAKLVNLQSPSRAFQVGEQHYDTGNDVFEAMLDKRMIYSCGYWEHAANLDEAQEHKLEMICRKLELRPGEKLLDIGCGWGGLAVYAAEKYGVDVVGVTVSEAQRALAAEHCRGLPVDIRLMDYREIDGQFDKIVSVGMFEHVGVKNYPGYFRTANRLLKDDGLFLLHTIGNNVTSSRTDPWIGKYIFPNGKLPSAAEIAKVTEKLFLIEDWHNFGQDYDRTLMAWHENFENAWPRLRDNYSERFRRMWLFYLSSCAGFFRSRQGQLWQIVLSKRQRRDTYRSFRLTGPG